LIHLVVGYLPVFWQNTSYSYDSSSMVMLHSHNHKTVSIGSDIIGWHRTSEKPRDLPVRILYSDTVFRAVAYGGARIEITAEGSSISQSWTHKAYVSCSGACVVRRPMTHEYGRHLPTWLEWRIARVVGSSLQLGRLEVPVQRERALCSTDWMLKSCAAVMAHTVVHLQRHDEESAESVESALVYYHEEHGFLRVQNLFPDLEASGLEVGLPLTARKVLGVENVWQQDKWLIAIGLGMANGSSLLRVTDLDLDSNGLAL